MHIKTLIWILNRQLESLYDPLALELNIPSAGLEVLVLLFQRDGQQPGELSDQIGRASTSFTPLVDRLVEAGYVKRKPHPHDRRAVQIWLTDKGRSIRPRLLKEMADNENLVRGHLLARFGDQAPADVLETLLAPLPNNL